VTTLLIDVGNTRIKWARVRPGKSGRQHAAAHVGWTAKDYARRVFGRRAAARVVVSSVAGLKVNRMLIAAARIAAAPAPEFVVSRRKAGGITTAYLEPWRLGVDRFVGVIGARRLCGGRAVCVVNVGTAVTIDLVDGLGRHRGGAIIPGPALMVDSLLSSTSGIRRRAQSGRRGVRSLFARSTRTAIGQGAAYAVAAVIDRAMQEARVQIGRRPKLLLTGGGATSIVPLLRHSCVRVPDLVLQGLAVWAGVAAPPKRVLPP